MIVQFIDESKKVLLCKEGHVASSDGHKYGVGGDMSNPFSDSGNRTASGRGFAHHRRYRTQVIRNPLSAPDNNRGYAGESEEDMFE